ncbi:protein-glutamine glutaminase family protein [Bdellovibrio reynosensis]|uniref:Protein glutaminase domain-containing protein n=1 Tax=Bdellovibrio reynosensis TaxID=2835041 RepID=A0ABY4C9V6_9BACT|nr:protein-glutamine glutaminase family protein [Bdellovibrio reynosensis]UOF00466.1 hypothetical protein MNR06_12230 [Bdellovibrio reynosensis]
MISCPIDHAKSLTLPIASPKTFVMKKLSLILLVSLFSSTVFAVGISAKRNRGETYKVAHLRNMSLKFNQPMGPFQSPEEPYIGSSNNVWDVKVPLKKLKIKEIPDLGSYADLENQFKILRDERFINKNSDFPRRSTWLYPDDGCFARAELMKTRLVDAHLPAPKKIFIFGDLWVSSKNARYGDISWWYHVAVTYRVGDEAYVLDPAIEPARPLKLAEWNHLMGGDKKRFDFSLCHPDTVDPRDDCKDIQAISLEKALEMQEPYLDYEWERLIELKRDPQAELGAFPPWLMN